MNRLIQPILAFALLLLTSATLFAQTTYYYDGSGAVHLTASWGVNLDGTGANPPNFTSANQIFEFRNSSGTILTANWTVSGTGSKVIVGNGMSSTTLNTSNFTISGIFDVESNSVLNVASNSTSLTMGILSIGSTVVYSGDIDQSVRAGNYHHLSLNGTSAMRTKTASGAISVAGTLTVQNNNTLALGTNPLTGTFTTAGTGVIVTINTTATPIPSAINWSQTVAYNAAGNQTVVAGTYENLTMVIDGTTARTRTAGGDITVNNELTLDVTGTGVLTFALGTNQLINGGSLNPKSVGTGTLTTRVISTTRPTLALPAGLTWPYVVQYNAAMDLISGTYESLTIGTTGIKSATGNVVVNTTLTSTGALNMNANSLSGSFTQTGTGNITTAGSMPSGKTWTSAIVFYNATGAQNVAPGTYTSLNISGGNRTITGTVAISTTFTTGSGVITTTGSTIELNGAGAQTITITGQTSLVLNNLSVTNGTAKTFSNTAADVTINGNLSIPSGLILTMGTNRLIITNGTPALLGSGTLNTTSTLSNPISSGLSWPYTVSLNSTSNDQLPAGTYQNLSITGGGTTSVQGNITVVNNFTYSGAINMGTHQLSGIAGTISGTSTLSTQNTSANPLPTGKTWTGIITYNAAADQTIADAVSYNSLTIAGGGSFVKAASGNLTILATLSVSASTILDMGTHRIVSATTYTNSGTTRTQNTSANPIPTMAVPIVGTVEYNAVGNQTVVPNTYTNLNLSGGGNRTLTGIINITGTFTATSGNIIGGTSDFRLTGGTQILNLGATGSFNHFSVLGTGTKTITAGTGNLVVDGDLTINSTLAITTNQLLGLLTAADGTGTLTTTHIATTLPIPASSVWGFTVNFAGNGQTVPEGIYSNLIISANTTTKTAGGNISVNNNLSFSGNASTTLDMDVHRLINIPGTIAGIGTIRTKSTHASPIPAGKSWTQTVIYESTSAQTVVHGNYIALNIAGGDRTVSDAGVINITGAFTANTDPATYITTGTTINFNGVAQTLTFNAANPFPFNDVSFTSAAPATKTIAGGGFDVDGDLNIGADVIVNMATFAMGGNPASITGSGQLNTQCLVNPPLPSGETWPLIVNYNSTSTTPQPVVGGTYTGGLNLSITTAARTKVAVGNITVVGDIIFTSTGTGALTFNMSEFDLIAGLGFNIVNDNPGAAGRNIQTQSTSATPLPSGITWPTDFTILYNNNNAVDEQNVVAATYQNLTCTGLALKNAAGNITVNGILNLGANQNDDRGQLEMTVDYDIYGTGAYSTAPGYDPLNPNSTPGNLSDLRNSTHPFNNLNSHILLLGPDATVTGAGDVTGKVRRTTIANEQMYQFSNENMQLTFNNTGGGTLPTQITVIHTRGAFGLHADKDTVGSRTARRLYQVLKTGGTDPALMTIRFPYSNTASERNGATQAQTADFVIWDHHIPYGGATPHEHGKTKQLSGAPATHWIELTGHFVGYLANEGSTGFTKYWMMGRKYTTEPLWLGAITGGAWNNPSNWVDGTVPTSLTSVVIPDATTTANDPVLSGDISVGTVEIQPGGLLTAGANRITVNGKPATNGGRGSWLNNGTFVSTGVVEFTAEDATLAGTTTFEDIEIASGASLIIQNDAQTTLLGSLINNGELNAASNNNTFIYAGDAQTIVNPNATLISGYRNLTIGGTGTTTLPGTLELTGNLELNKALTFTGNTIIFKGSGAKTISGSNYPAAFGGLEIDGAGAILNLPENTVVGGTLTITNGVLNLADNNLTLNGGFSSSAGNGIRFDGTNTLTIAGAGSIGNLFFDQSVPGISNRVANLVYNRASETITLSDTLEIVNEVTPTNGTLNANGRLKLISNALGTARIGSGTGSYITGNVTAQRFIPDAGGRGTRFLSSPVSGATMLDWRGEIFITGPGTGNTLGTLNSNGFDASANNAHTVFRYNEPTVGPSTNGWVGPADINEPIQTGLGYRVFVRGDRSSLARLTNTATPQNEVTLDLRGTVNTGNITLPVTHTVTPGGGVGIDGSNLVGNPYPSNYNWKSFFDDISTSKTNINPEIFLWNPVTKNYDGYNASGAGSGLGEMTSGIIPQGAAFWVQAINPGPTSLILTEAHKVATTGGDLFKTVDNSMFKLFMDGPNGVQDEMAVRYMNGATVNRDIYDLREMAGTISISAYGSDSIQLAITCRPLNVANNDTIRMNVSAANGNYTFRFANVEAIPVADQVFLIDNHTNQAINLNTNPSYSFSINSTIPTTTGNGRFYIVVANTNQVPVELLSFSARGNSAQQVELKWETASEINTSHFEIERSADGASFETLFAVKANGKAGKLTSYTQVDKAPYAVGYYRLKMVDKDGSYAHSAIRIVRFDNADIAASLKMYPVPASKSLTIELGETMSSIRIHNAMGKEVYTSKVGTEQFVVPVETLAAGVYTIEIITTTGSKVIERFVKE